MQLADPLMEMAKHAAPPAGEPIVYSAGAEHRPIERRVWRRTELDARGRPPPKPADAIRAALANAVPGDELYVRTNTQPNELIQALQRHGIATATAKLPDGSWRTHVWRE